MAKYFHLEVAAKFCQNQATETAHERNQNQTYPPLAGPSACRTCRLRNRLSPVDNRPFPAQRVAGKPVPSPTRRVIPRASRHRLGASARNSRMLATVHTGTEFSSTQLAKVFDAGHANATP